MDGTELLKVLLAAFAGAVAAWVTVKTRLALLEYRMSQSERRFKRMDATLRQLERRQIVQIQQLSDISNAMGLAKRTPDDVLMRVMQEGDDDTPDDEHHRG